MRSVLALLLVSLTLSACGGSSSSSNPPPTTAAASAPGTAPGGLNHVHSILIEPSNPNVLYLGTHYHLYKSIDGGRRWKAMSSQMMLAIAQDPKRASTLYAVSSKNGLLKSTDAGGHWTAVSGLPKGAIVGIASEPVNGNLFAYGVGIYRSANRGASWSEVLRGQSVRSVSFGRKGVVYAASDNGVFVSRDGGVKWKTVKALSNQPIIQVASAAGTAYAVTPVAVYKTTNDGKSWKPLGAAPAGIQFIGVSPSKPQEVLADVAGRGFFVTTNGGETWRGANKGIKDTNFNASTIRVAPSAPNVIYTGAWGLHFYASRDGGRHWSEVATLVR